MVQHSHQRLAVVLTVIAGPTPLRTFRIIEREPAGEACVCGLAERRGSGNRPSANA